MDYIQHLFQRVRSYPHHIYNWIRNNAKPRLELKMMYVSRWFKHEHRYPIAESIKANNHGLTLKFQDSTQLQFGQLQDLPDYIIFTTSLCLSGPNNLVFQLITKASIFRLEVLELR